MEHPEFTDFIAYLHLKNLAPATIKGYRLALKGLFDYIALGPSPPSQITTAQLRDYVANLYERGLAAKTIKNYILAINGFFGFLLAEGYIQEGPSRRIPTPKESSKNNFGVWPLFFPSKVRSYFWTGTKVGKRLPRALTIPRAQALFMAISDETPAGCGWEKWPRLGCQTSIGRRAGYGS